MLQQFRANSFIPFILVLLSGPTIADPLCRPDDPSSYEDCCYETDVNLKKYCPSKQSAPQRPTPVQPDTCRVFGNGMKPQVNAEATHTARPVPDLSKSSNFLARLHPNERVSGVRTGETTHVDGNGALTPIPFSTWKGNWRAYPSTQGRFKCVVLPSIDFKYNKLQIFIPAEFTGCARQILAHESQHYDYVSGLDAVLAGNLTRAIESLGLPSISNPVMVRPDQVQIVVKRGEALIRGKVVELTNVYADNWNAHKRALDTNAEYTRLCGSCFAWPPGVCR